MKKVLTVLLTFVIVALCCVFPASAATSNTLSVSADNISHEVSSTLYGTFIEDISKACDGGLVSNLVYNNSFEYNDAGEDNAELNEAYWLFENIEHELSSESPMNENNTHYEILTVSGTGTVTNIGCVEDWDYQTWNPNSELQSTPDMGFSEGVKYDFSCYFKNVDFNGTVTVYLDSASNEDSRVEVDLSGLSGEWVQFSAVLESAASEDGALAIEFSGSGTLLMDFAQLVSQDSYGYGTDEWQFTTLRSDLAQAIIDLNPSFIRFPGGCFCEGDSLENLYNWKDTIGPVEQRVQTYNVWRNDSAGDYYINSNFMGYGEYFNLCADIGAEPVPCLNVGLTCQGRNNYDYNVDAYEKLSMTDEEFKQYLIDVRGYWEDDEEGLAARAEAVDALGYESEDDWWAYVETIALTPGTEEWDEYVNDILDLIEFANGDSETTYWGALRAEYGHEEPYNLKYLELGNENWGEIYWRNFEALYAEVKAVYPDITIITTAGTSGSGDAFDYAWETANESYSDCYVDEHYYTASSYLYEINDRYDSYDRSGAKVFLGEWAATADGWGTMQTKSNMIEAVEEATYMTALERNSDIVAMSCYAPTFAKVNSQNWTINEIWFDSQETVLTPAYYTQMLYTNNTGTQYIDTSFSDDVDVKELAQSVTVDADEQVIYVKIVNSSGAKQTVDINIDGFENINYVSNQCLSEYFAGACNEVGKTCYVAPVDEELKYTTSSDSTTITLKAGEYSVNVIRIAYGDNDGADLWQLPDSTPEDGTYIPLWLRITIPSVIGAVAVVGAAAAVIVHVVKKKKSKKSQ
ncbi:MAG: hypothetical protein LUH82_05375 [Clostridiales bacterium]|nr:hypothetical protein [Clostridiales bacterium]